MAKDKLTDYSSTNSLNTDVGGISIDEGMLPSNVNDAIREVMTHLKDFAEGTQAVNAVAVDNLKLDANTLSSTNTNGNIVIDPNGTGSVQLGGNLDTNGNDITFGNNDKAIFGASDLEIYSTGTSSFIKENGSGNLNILGTEMYFINSANNEYLAQFTTDGGCSLRYDNGTKLATTASGVSITGSLDADGLTVEGAAQISGVTEPSLKLFESDTTDVNTKLANAAGDFRIYTINDAGSEVAKRFQIDHPTGDISFLDSSGVSQGFFWDASTQRLGLGDTAPDKPLHVNGGTLNVSARIESTDAISMMDFVDSNTTVAPSFGAQTNDLIFYTNNSEKVRITSGGNVGIGGTPQGKFTVDTTNGILNIANANTSGGTKIQAWGATPSNGYLAFEGYTKEYMRLDSSGHLLVGKTTTVSNTAGHSIYSSGAVEHTRDSNTVLYVNRTTTDGTISEFRKDGAEVGSIGANAGSLFISSPYGSDSGIRIGNSNVSPATTAGAARDAAIDLGYSANRFKDLYLSGGVYLGGTGASNLLDDYEEGTWTPTISNGITSPTYSVQNGTYTKVGRLVTYSLRLTLTAGTAAASILQIGGLPFSVASTPRGMAGSIAYAGNSIISSTTDNLPVFEAAAGSTLLSFYKTDGNQFLGTNLNSASTFSIDAGGQYFTN